ncbi:optic atrophy 3 protein, partial [Phenoliferia sp. Uapishka_3]
MASIKIASLFLKTLAKPLANKLKTQAKNNEGFRKATIAMAQIVRYQRMDEDDLEGQSLSEGAVLRELVRLEEGMGRHEPGGEPDQKRN